MTTNGTDKIFLFSVDLEDIRFRMKDGEKYKERVPANTHAYLEWLNNQKAKCTFFTVGDIAEAYPSLIGEILSEGHEIACHTCKHINIDQQTPDEFKSDLAKNIEYLQKAGATNISGFRAPVFSLTQKTQWAYRILAELGFKYSTSVFPAKNPLYGWENFGTRPKQIEGLLEIPMTVGKLGPITAAYGGGVYFRALPWVLLNRKINTHRTLSNPLLGYFHPYDIDQEQEQFMHPGINNSKLYNMLMYYNRGVVFKRLDAVMRKGFRILTYEEYRKSFLIQ